MASIHLLEMNFSTLEAFSTRKSEKINGLILFSTRHKVIFIDAIDSLLVLKAETQLFLIGEEERLSAEKILEIKFERQASVVPQSSTGG